jgi:hypothetical protein
LEEEDREEVFDLCCWTMMLGVLLKEQEEEEAVEAVQVKDSFCFSLPSFSSRQEEAKDQHEEMCANQLIFCIMVVPKDRIILP